MHATE
jgi:hypothetical protein